MWTSKEVTDVFVPYRPWETVQSLETYSKKQLIAHILWLYKKIESHEERVKQMVGR